MTRNSVLSFVGFSIACIVSMFVAAQPGNAADITLPLQIPFSGQDSVEICVGENCRGIPVYVNLAYHWLVGFAAVVAVLAITWGGVRWLTSGGESGKIEEARKVIGNALIGLLIALGSYAGLAAINPSLVFFKPLTVKPIKPLSLSVEDIDGVRDFTKGHAAPDATPTGAVKSGYPNLKFAKLSKVSGRGSTKFTYGGDINNVYASTRYTDTVFTGIPLDEKGRRAGPGTKEDLKDVPLTLIHEWIHFINTVSVGGGTLYVGKGVVIDALNSPDFDPKKIAQYVPPSFRYRHRYEVYAIRNWSQEGISPFIALDEFSAYVGDAKEALAVYKGGQWDKYGSSAALSGTIDFVVYGLALALATEKHDNRYMLHGGKFKDALRYLIEDGMETYIEMKKYPGRIYKTTAGSSVTIPLINDRENDVLYLLKTSKDAEALRDLAKRWYNVPPHTNWTQKWLGF